MIGREPAHRAVGEELALELFELSLNSGRPQLAWTIRVPPARR